jgi:hypothetical protein
MHRIAAKLFVKDSNGVDAKAFVPIFHRWIREHAVEGLLIDVADYGHVIDGPGVVLIGHEGDFGIDSVRGKPGLLHTRKRGFPADVDFKTQLREMLRGLFIAAKTIESEKTLDGKYRYRTDHLEVALQDRLAAPNTEAAFAALGPDLQAVLGEVFGPGVKFERAFTDAREALTVNVAAPGASDLATLISRTEATVAAR